MKIKNQKILAVIITILSLTSILITVNAATSTDFPVEVTDGTYTFRFATHTGSGTEGNWIKLTGGSDITLPEITLYYNGITSADYDKDGNNVVVDADNSILGDSVTYPYSTHPLYSTTQTITYTFNGRTSHAGLPVDVKLIKVDDPLDFQSAASDAFRGDTQALRDILTGNDPNNVVVQTKSGSLDGSGDISDNFGTQAAGDYIIAVMSQTGNTFILYSATPVEVLDGSLASTMDDEVDKGDDLDIDMTLTGGSTGWHIYGAVLIKESAYYANVRIVSQGLTDNTELTVNDATLIEGSDGGFSLFGGGLGDLEPSDVTDFLSEALDSDEYAVAYSSSTTESSYTLSVTTSDLSLGDYIVLEGVWDNSKSISEGNRLLGFTQDAVRLNPSYGLDFPVKVEIQEGGTTTDKILFADHTNSGTDGNWIKLSGGTSVTLPETTLSYSGITQTSFERNGKTVNVNAQSSIDGKTVTYPFENHQIYSTTDTVTYEFHGDPALMSNDVTVRLVPVALTEYRDAMSNAFNGDTSALQAIIDGSNAEYELSTTLDTGDLASTDITNPGAGDYMLLIMNEHDGSPYHLTIYSATLVEILDYQCDTSHVTRVDEGDDLDIDFTLTGATGDQKRYGVVLIKESAYTLDLVLSSDGSTQGTELTGNGAILIEGTSDSFSLAGVGLGSIDKDVLLDKLEVMLDSDEYAAAFSEYTADTSYQLSVTTDGLNEDDYIVLNGVWESGGNKLVSFVQDSVYVNVPAISPPAPAPTPTPTPEDVEELSDEEAAETLEELSDEDAADIVDELSDEKAAAVVQEMNTSKASKIMENVETEKANKIVENLDDEKAAEILDRVEDDKKNADILANQTTTKAARVAEKMNPSKVARAIEAGTNKMDQFTDMMNEVEEEAAASVLLETETQTGATVVQGMAEKDLNKAARRVEAAVKRRIQEQDPEKQEELMRKATQILEHVSVDSLVDLFVEIANLPETPSTVADVFEVMNKTKVLDVITAWVNVGELEELGMVFGYLTEDTLEDLWLGMTSGERTTLFPSLDVDTRAALPQLGEFTVVDLLVEPDTVEPGDSVTVTAVVQNIGDEVGSETIQLYVDDVEVDFEIVSLAPNETVTLEWTVSRNTPGQYTVTVMEESATFVVEAPPVPAEFTFSGLQVSPTTVEPGDDVAVTFTVDNTGEQSGAYSAAVALDGETVETLVDTLVGGASDSVTITLTAPEEAGTHMVSIDGLEVEFTVEAPPSRFLMYAAIVAIVVLAVAGYIYMQRQQ